MRLKINNLALVEDASVEIDGITVIAGENNTGKSTIGKALYCAFNSFYKSEKRLIRERKRQVRNEVSRFARLICYTPKIQDSHLRPVIVDTMMNAIAARYDFNGVLEEGEIEELCAAAVRSLEDVVADGDESVQRRLFDEIGASANSFIINLRAVLLTSDDELLRAFLSRSFNEEFNRRINSIYNNSPASITLCIGDGETTIEVNDNDVVSLSDAFVLETEILYIDDPFVLDDVADPRVNSRIRLGRGGHRHHLESHLLKAHEEPTIFEELLDRRKIGIIEAKFQDICNGELSQDSPREVMTYEMPDSETSLDVRSLSSGLKTFVIVKELLLNGSLEEHGTIILDEPEIHLHPEWQLIFAEVIVLLQKEYNMHILLNTHSPYFLRAIQVFAGRYAIADRCHYYLAELDSRASKSSIVADATDKVELIYKKLARPLQTLEDVAFHDEF